MGTEPEVGQKAGRREWIGLAVISLACLLYVMDLSVLYLAVPALTRELQPSSTQLLWITDIYGFMVAGFLITMGTLGDRIGRRRVLMVGAAGFGAASLLAAFSTSSEMLIASRALLGIAGATIAPSTLSLIRNMFEDDRQRTTAISIWGASFAAGGPIGEMTGGLLLEFFWWGSVFLINVPVMVALLLMGPRFLPEFRDRSAGLPDLPSVALSLAGVLSVIYGLKEMAQDGPGLASILPILAGLGLGAIFVRRQRRLSDPLIDLGLFRVPKFTVSVLSNTMTGFIAFGTFLFIAQYLQLVVGLSPLSAAIWSLPASLSVVLSSVLAPAITKMVRPAYGVAGGLLITSAGLAILTQVDATSGLGVLVAGSVVFSIGLGPVFILATDLILGTAPPERAGAASAISETGAEFGGALGIALLGSIGTAVYRRALTDDLLFGVPPVAAQTARDTLGGALVAAQGLPEQAGTMLADAAREAFIRGLHIAVLTGAIIGALIALVVAIRLREVRSGGEEAQEPPPDVASRVSSREA